MAAILYNKLSSWRHDVFVLLHVSDHVLGLPKEQLTGDSQAWASISRVSDTHDILRCLLDAPGHRVRDIHWPAGQKRVLERLITLVSAVHGWANGCISRVPAG